MATVIAQRPRPFRPLVFGTMQLAIAAGWAWLLLRGGDASARDPSLEPVRLGVGILLFLPFALLGVRNLHRLIARAHVTVDEQGVSALVPTVPFWLSPLLRSVRWSSSWSAVEPEFLSGAHSILSIAGDGAPLMLRGGEFDVSLYDLDERIRASAPPGEAERLAAPRVVRRFAGTPVLWLAILGFGLLVATFGLLAAVQSSGREPSGLLTLPLLAAFGFLALASGGRREAIVDERGFFLVQGRRVAFLPADLVSLGEAKKKGEFPGFSLLTVSCLDEGRTITVKMNEILGVGLPLSRVLNELETRMRKGFENAGPKQR